MKHFLTIIFSLFILSAFGQTYYLKYDSLKVLKLKPNNTYTFKTETGKKTERFSKIKGDSFYFETNTYSYKEILEFKNPKRNLFTDIIAFPVTIGSCVAISTIPISYIKGYFLADGDVMFRTLGFFIIETVIFNASRSYIAKNPKWIKVSGFTRLDLKVIK